jgi:hypothetical protein
VALAADVGPARAWDAGEDGRLLLEPLCSNAPDLLTSGGDLFLVHSEFAGVDCSLEALRAAGLSADVVARQSIPFGPVYWPGRRGWNASASWNEAAATNNLSPFSRTNRDDEPRPSSPESGALEGTVCVDRARGSPL